MKEKHVRDWVRKVWAGRPVTWVEPRRGSTVGAADLYLPVGPLLLPVELKVFDETESGFVVGDSVRPAQVVYHHHLHNVGVVTGFLFGLKGESKGMYYVPGTKVVACMLRERVADRFIDRKCCYQMSSDRDLNDRWLRICVLGESNKNGNLLPF